jgi:hypothetical protein
MRGRRHNRYIPRKILEECTETGEIKLTPGTMSIIATYLGAALVVAAARMYAKTAKQRGIVIWKNLSPVRSIKRSDTFNAIHWDKLCANYTIIYNNIKLKLTCMPRVGKSCNDSQDVWWGSQE